MLISLLGYCSLHNMRPAATRRLASHKGADCFLLGTKYGYMSVESFCGVDFGGAIASAGRWTVDLSYAVCDVDDMCTWLPRDVASRRCLMLLHSARSLQRHAATPLDDA